MEISIPKNLCSPLMPTQSDAVLFYFIYIDALCVSLLVVLYCSDLVL